MENIQNYISHKMKTQQNYHQKNSTKELHDKIFQGSGRKKNADDDIWKQMSHTGRTSYDNEEERAKKIIMEIAAGRVHGKTNRTTIVNNHSKTKQKRK